MGRINVLSGACTAVSGEKCFPGEKRRFCNFSRARRSFSNGSIQGTGKRRALTPLARIRKRNDISRFKPPNVCRLAGLPFVNGQTSSELLYFLGVYSRALLVKGGHPVINRSTLKNKVPRTEVGMEVMNGPVNAECL